MKKRKKLNKRCLAIFMTLMMVMGSFQITVFADGELPNTDEPEVTALEDESQTEAGTSADENSESSEGEAAVDGDGETDESEPSADENGEPSEGEAKEPWDLTTDTKRPEGTVEVKPGDAEHADFDENTVPDESENPENPGETPEAPGENPENPGENPEIPGENPENPGETLETPSETPENPWDVFYDKDTDTYKLTFKIDENAEGNQVIDLTLALELLGQYSDYLQNNASASTKTVYDDNKLKEIYDNATEPGSYPQELIDIAVSSGKTTAENAEKWIDEDLFWHFTYGQPLNSNFQAALDKWNAEAGGTKVDRPDALEPGDIRKFEISLTSGSKHTYVYKNGSFTLATPDFSDLNAIEGNKSDVIGFDGQNLPYKDPINNFNYVDTATYYISYRSEVGIELQRAALKANNVTTYDYDFKNYDNTGNPGCINVSSRDIQCYVGPYLKSLYSDESTDEARITRYIIEYYNNKLDGKYDNLATLLDEHPDIFDNLSGESITMGDRYLDFGSGNIKIDAHTGAHRYNKFYKSLLSFIYGDFKHNDGTYIEGTEGKINEVTGEQTEYPGQYENDSWSSGGWNGEDAKYRAALAYYMAHEEIWKTTDKLFDQLIGSGLTAEQATWSSFMMAINIDGFWASNDWQDTLWPWHNSIILERNDYDFNLVKKDAETGETIATATKFYIWYINSEGEKVYIKYNGVDEDGEDQFEETTEVSALETTNGNLSVIYTLMKDKVYYLQEAEAPEGYELDPKIYVLTDSIDKANAEIEDQKNEINDKIAGLQDELDAIIAANPDYTAASKKFQELKEKVDKYLAEDKDSNAADAADYAKYLQEEFNKLVSSMGITELENMLTSNASGVSDAVNAFNVKKDELSDLLVKANDRIAELNASLQSAYDSFQEIKAKYTASEDTAERADLRAQLVEIQTKAQQIIADLAAVKAEYEASELHSEYEAVHTDAQSKLDTYNGYLNTWMTRNNSIDIMALKDKLNTLKELKAAQEALNNNDVSINVKALEDQIKIAEESVKSFIPISEDSEWMEKLELNVDFKNDKKTQEKDFNVELTEKSFTGFTMPYIFEGVLIEALNLTFEVPDPDPTPENPTPSTPDPTPSNPSSPGSPNRPSNPPSDIPEPDVPLTNIPEEEPPLVNIPEEEPPLANIPDEEPPLADIPEEEPPLAEIPDEEPPLADIPDEDVPLDTVPQTGDDSHTVLWMALMLLALCAIACIVFVPGIRRNKR